VSSRPVSTRAERASGASRGFVDLHSHWIATIDDGARTPADGVLLLERLHAAGFAKVVATPHMRPGMFENDRGALERAYAAMMPHLDAARAAGVALPEIGLSSEHFFDDIVFQRLARGEGLPYSIANADNHRGYALIEFPPDAFPTRVQARLFDLRRMQKLTSVIAHPERYQPVWKDAACLEPLVDAGAFLQMDLCSLVGKYGSRAKRAAEDLLENDAYEIACSDAHKPDDVDDVVRSIQRLESLVGKDELNRLLADAPRALIGKPSGGIEGT
jgi:protein-tyrosine phosphatase